MLRRYQIREVSQLCLIIWLGVWFYGCCVSEDSSERSIYSLEGFTMGTSYVVKVSTVSFLQGNNRLELQREIDELLESLNDQMSTYRDQSEISRFNRSSSFAPVAISSGFVTVVREAIALSNRTGGAFDPTLDPLINLWGFGNEGSMDTLPSEDRVNELLDEIGVRFLEISDEGLLSKIHPGLKINLNAIAKGYAVDAVSDLLASKGYVDTFVEIGGEVLARGKANEDRPWRVGVETPDANNKKRESVEAVVDLTGRAMATSGNYRNFILDDDGDVLSHILDPRNGHPVTHRLVSVSVLADSCMLADGVATALFVMGVEEGMAWIEANEGIEALFIESIDEHEFRQLASSGFLTN